MKEQDKHILQEIQKNTQMAVDSIEEVIDKIEEKEFLDMVRSMGEKYNGFERKALCQMGREGIPLYHRNPMEKVMLKSGIMMNTMLDISTSHIAEMIIQGNNRGITDLYKVLNHNPKATFGTMELAKELMDFEEETIEDFKKYL